MKRPVWVLKAAVLAFHAECLRLHGGSAGIRDEGLLESALARPKHLETYEHADLCGLAAAYAVGIAKNHPFVDGNKRTAFLTATVFLECNGLRFTADPAHAAVFMLAVADGTLDATGFAAWLRDNTKKATRRPAPKKPATKKKAGKKTASRRRTAN
ncbi:MAG: type II toxin-antitoxin system death-on-curing family toxin [Planctomycetes bacterium]|nr:type II toxin-antitoxin system death-on-curing family toxin [Planctomycetota bacterium]